ncbi:MAG: shikimate kinase [Bacteroidaceae bacterium]|jgi:shikimate kinase
MTRIFLIGYMAAGKTTLGRALARTLNLQFLDLDQYIEQRQHATITTLFERHGEAGFRQIERQHLHEAGEFENTLIACGGGTPCHFDNIDYMNRQGQTVFLSVPLPVLLRRLRANRSKRPLLAQKTDAQLHDYIAAQLQERLPYYTQARYTFPADSLESSAEIAESVTRFREMLNL